jgi:hypothetical protein
MDGTSVQPGLTAYPEQEQRLRETHALAPLMVETLRRPIRRCDLAQCKGMCCYDGVYVEAEAADVLQRLARDEADFFRSLGMDLPREVIVMGEWKGRFKGPKTAVLPRPFSRTVEDFPAHFHDTACVFLTPDGRCGLQVLSQARGKHPWYYKPFTCWMYPLTTSYDDKRAEGEKKPDKAVRIGLYDEHSDPCQLPEEENYPGYVSVIQCGRTAPCGEPAYRVLREELAFLGQIIGRDLAAESSRGEPPAPPEALTGHSDGGPARSPGG